VRPLLLLLFDFETLQRHKNKTHSKKKQQQTFRISGEWVLFVFLELTSKSSQASFQDVIGAIGEKKSRLLLLFDILV
jgi:hypothetical protein